MRRIDEDSFITFASAVGPIKKSERLYKIRPFLAIGAVYNPIGTAVTEDQNGFQSGLVKMLEQFENLAIFFRGIRSV